MHIDLTSLTCYYLLIVYFIVILFEQKKEDGDAQNLKQIWIGASERQRILYHCLSTQNRNSRSAPRSLTITRPYPLIATFSSRRLPMISSASPTWPTPTSLSPLLISLPQIHALPGVWRWAHDSRRSSRNPYRIFREEDECQWSNRAPDARVSPGEVSLQFRLLRPQLRQRVSPLRQRVVGLRCQTAHERQVEVDFRNQSRYLC